MLDRSFQSQHVKMCEKRKCIAMQLGMAGSRHGNAILMQMPDVQESQTQNPNQNHTNRLCRAASHFQVMRVSSLSLGTLEGDLARFLWAEKFIVNCTIPVPKKLTSGEAVGSACDKKLKASRHGPCCQDTSLFRMVLWGPSTCST